MLIDLAERGCVADQPQQFDALQLTLRAQPRSKIAKEDPYRFCFHPPSSILHPLRRTDRILN